MSEAQRHAGLGWFAVRNLVRRWRRSLAVGVPLALAIAVATAATLIADGIRRDAARAAERAPDLSFQRLQQGRLLPLEHAPLQRALLDTGQVASVAERVFVLVPAPGDEDGSALATLIGADWSRAAPPAGVVKGRLPAPDERGVVALGRGVAGRLEIGHRWKVPTSSTPHPLKIVGILSDEVAVHGANMALTSMHDARVVAGLEPTEVSEVSATLRPGANPIEISDDVRGRFPGIRVIGRSALARILDAIYGSRSGAFLTIWLVLLLVAPAVAWALGMDIAASERRELGVLKALGWSTLELIETRMIEGGLLGLLATLGGAVLGMIFALLGAPGLADLFIGWTAIYPSFPPPLALEAGSALALFGLGIVPLLAASAVPAWRIGSTPPEAVMRD